MSTESKETMTIGNAIYYVERKEMRQADLKFYSENPRVYSALRHDSLEEPSQEEIENCMKQMDHVKKLKLSIESNGGLIDPLIVRKGDNVVLEGNSRLAAYRILCATDPITWGMIKCVLLPEDISDTAVFQLLGQYHIVGRKDWSPFEQGGYLYRRLKTTKYPVEQMAKELGISKSVARTFVEVYTFMIEHDDVTPDKWSYYEEYLKNTNIKQERKKDPELDNIIVDKVKSGEIEKAQDMRKLGDIIALDNPTSKKAVEEIKTGSLTITEAHNDLNTAVQVTDIIKQLERFRKSINSVEVMNTVLNSEGDSKENVKFVLEKIQKRINTMLNKIDKDD